MAHPYFDLARPVALGHRGAAGHAPENTLVAFRRGLELGAQIIETDVHATRDGVPVLLHDPAVDRTTDGVGDVGSLALASLEKLDAGCRFREAGDAFPFRGQGITVPSLDECFRALPGVRFNLEIKANPPGLLDEVVSLVKRHGREDTTLLTAGEDDIMAALRAAIRRAGIRPAIGASLGDVLAVIRATQSDSPPPEDVMALQIPAEFGGQPLVTRALLDYAHAHEIQIHVWTINEPDEIRRLVDLGVDGIVSDFPDRVAALQAL